MITKSRHLEKRKAFQKINGSERGKKGERSESILMVSSCRAGRTGETASNSECTPSQGLFIWWKTIITKREKYTRNSNLTRGKKQNEYQLKPARLRKRKQKK